MYSGHTVGVVVPAYNEVGFVGGVIDTVPAYVDRVYVVDDRSTDGTWAEIRRHASAANRRRVADESESELSADGGQPFDRPVVAIRHDRNRGVGGAIKTGYQRALDDEIDVTAVLAGDGQMDPDFLPRLLDPIVEGEAGYAKGNRLLTEANRGGMSRWRLTGNVILSFLTKIASGYWRTMDPQNGYTAISRDALERVDVDAMYESYGYCNDLLVRLNAAAVRVADVSIPAIYGEEESSIRYGHYIRTVSGLLVRMFLWRLQTRYLVRECHPLVLFYATGALSAALGLLNGLRSVRAVARSAGSGTDGGGGADGGSGRTNGGSDADGDANGRGGPGGSLALFGVGWVLALFAMVFDRRENESLEVRRDG